MSITLSAVPPPIYLSAAESARYVTPQTSTEASAPGGVDGLRLETGDGAAQPLDKLLLGAIQQAGASTEHRLAEIQALIAQPTSGLFDGEEKMINLQSSLGELNIAVSLQLALANRSVKAVETLVRS